VYTSRNEKTCSTAAVCQAIGFFAYGSSSAAWQQVNSQWSSMMLTIGFFRCHVIWPCSSEDPLFTLWTDDSKKKHPSHLSQTFGLHLRANQLWLRQQLRDGQADGSVSNISSIKSMAS
jgi:hypothetical protein